MSFSEGKESVCQKERPPQNKLEMTLSVFFSSSEESCFYDFEKHTYFFSVPSSSSSLLYKACPRKLVATTEPSGPISIV